MHDREDGFVEIRFGGPPSHMIDLSNAAHVYPVGDATDHVVERHGQCWCEPTVWPPVKDFDGMVVHKRLM